MGHNFRLYIYIYLFVATITFLQIRRQLIRRSNIFTLSGSSTQLQHHNLASEALYNLQYGLWRK